MSDIGPLLVYPLIYVLECEDNCWYVGITSNLNYRWSQHLAGTGAKWTRLHKPIRIAEVYVENCSTERENAITKQYSEKYGAENVRGGFHTKC